MLPTQITSKFIVDPAGCWVWQKSITGGGYGYINWKRKTQKAVRIIYKMLVGPIPPGLQLDHLCRNRACVNPQHVEPVTSRENTMRGLNASAVKARQTACYKGHPFDTTNTYVRSNGTRLCRSCHNINEKKRRENLSSM